MDWIGLKEDEGPYFQTKRFDRYKEVVQKLVDGALDAFVKAASLEIRKKARLKIILEIFQVPYTYSPHCFLLAW